MFTLIVTALAVLAVLGFLARIAESVSAETVTTASRRSTTSRGPTSNGTASDGHTAANPLRAPVHPRGAR